MQVVDGASFFPNKDEILNYLKLSIDFQQKHHQKESAFASDAQEKLYLIAHRGVFTHAAENSLNAFKAARDLQADGLEFDVSATKDGKLIVYHGPSVARHTTCASETREVCQMTWEELQACKLKDGQKILTLEEMLPQVKNRFSFLFLDFKVAEHPACQQSVDKLFEDSLSLIKKNKMEAKVIFSSYDKGISKMLAKRGDFSTALDTFDLKAMDQLSGSYFSYFMTPAENFSQPVVEKLAKQGIEAVAYVVNDVKYAKKLKAMGVRFLMTDELEALKAAMD